MQAKDSDMQILEKIAGYCDDIEFTHGEYHRDYAVFCSSPTCRNAVSMCPLQI